MNLILGAAFFLIVLVLLYFIAINWIRIHFTNKGRKELEEIGQMGRERMLQAKKDLDAQQKDIAKSLNKIRQDYASVVQKQRVERAQRKADEKPNSDE